MLVGHAMLCGDNILMADDHNGMFLSVRQTN